MSKACFWWVCVFLDVSQEVRGKFEVLTDEGIWVGLLLRGHFSTFFYLNIFILVFLSPFATSPYPSPVLPVSYFLYPHFSSRCSFIFLFFTSLFLSVLFHPSFLPPPFFRFLTKREQQLMHRRHHAEELLQWKQRLDQEEAEVCRMEKEALAVWERNAPQDKKDEMSNTSPGTRHHQSSETRTDSEKGEADDTHFVFASVANSTNLNIYNQF